MSESPMSCRAGMLFSAFRGRTEIKAIYSTGFLPRSLPQGRHFEWSMGVERVGIATRITRILFNRFMQRARAWIERNVAAFTRLLARTQFGQFYAAEQFRRLNYNALAFHLLPGMQPVPTAQWPRQSSYFTRSLRYQVPFISIIFAA